MVLLVILLADVDEIIKHKRKNLKNYKGAFVNRDSKPKIRVSIDTTLDESIKNDNQPLLIDIAKNDSNSNVRMKATMHITDMSALISIAKNDPSYDVRGEAIKKISDKTVLLEIAKNDSSYGIRKTIVNKIGINQIKD